MSSLSLRPPIHCVVTSWQEESFPTLTGKIAARNQASRDARYLKICLSCLGTFAATGLVAHLVDLSTTHPWATFALQLLHYGSVGASMIAHQKQCSFNATTSRLEQTALLTDRLVREGDESTLTALIDQAEKEHLEVNEINRLALMQLIFSTVEAAPHAALEGEMPGPLAETQEFVAKLQRADQADIALLRGIRTVEQIRHPTFLAIGSAAEALFIEANQVARLELARGNRGWATRVIQEAARQLSAIESRHLLIKPARFKS